MKGFFLGLDDTGVELVRFQIICGIHRIFPVFLNIPYASAFDKPAPLWDARVVKSGAGVFFRRA
jgi:hypothetical protein